MIHIEEIEISDKIKIPRENIEVDSQLRTKFTYKYGKEIFSTLNFDDDYWYLPTGALEKLQVDKIIDNRKWEQVENRFKLNSDLRKEQIDVVNEFFPGPRSGIIQAKCGWGKTYTGCSIIAKSNVPTLVVVHTRLLFYQWQAELKEQISNASIGMIGDGLYSVGDITVAIYKSLKNYTEELKNQFSLMVVDEVHRCPAKLFEETVNSFACREKIGISATPKRRDGRHLLLSDYFTNFLVIAKDTDDKPTPRVEITQTDIPFHIRNPKREWARGLTTLCSNSEYIKLIANWANHDVGNGRCVLIPSDRINLLDELLKLVPQSVKLVGTTPQEQRDSILENIGKTHKCILTTSIFDEGISAHRLDTIYLTCPSSNLTRLEQRIGRIEREHPDKHYPLIRDFWLVGNIVMGQQGHRGRWYHMTRPAPSKKSYMIKKVVGVF